MTKKEKVLNFLRVVGGSSNRARIMNEPLQKHGTASDLDELLNTVLSGLVEVKDDKWVLTKLGWAEANALASVQPVQDPPPADTEQVSQGFARFRRLAKENPDTSPQRLLQLAGRHIGDPLEADWAEWRETHPEWYFQQPRVWHAKDVELDADGYPLRYPENPLTLGEHEDRPKTERGWFEWATRQPGASLEPLAKEMPAFECSNIVRVTRKVGTANAIDIFGQAKIDLAHQLVGVKTG